MSKEMRIIFIAVYVLLGLGLVMTYSASAIYAEHFYHNFQHFLVRQIFYAAAGTLILFATAAVPTSFWKKNSRVCILLSIVLLMLVYIPKVGHAAGGARRWIGLGFFNFQPAEFAKIAICLYLADYLSRKKKLIKAGDIRLFIPPLILVGIVAGLTVLQPDLGSCAFILLVVAILFFWSGLDLRYVAGAALVAIPVLYMAVIRVPYRLSRVTAYMNPWQDPQGSGFQMIQSLLSFALGGWRGAGLGQGIQKLFYLPSSYNDFIFSVISEELGLFGVFGVMFLYAVIFVCGIQMAEKAEQDYERLLIMSLTLMIVLQALIHMLVTIGLIPTKGLPLPFVSFGGTSLVFNMMAVGLLLGLDRQFRGSR